MTTVALTVLYVFVKLYVFASHLNLVLQSIYSRILSVPFIFVIIKQEARRRMLDPSRESFLLGVNGVNFA